MQKSRPQDTALFSGWICLLAMAMTALNSMGKTSAMPVRLARFSTTTDYSQLFKIYRYQEPMCDEMALVLQPKNVMSNNHFVIFTAIY